MPAPSFTIITVTYNLLKDNRGDTFRQAVQSVCDQTYPHIEHVVIDGGSNDGSVALIEELHKAGKISRYISEPDKGIYDAMNKGAALATGDYILYLNSDDYYHDRDGLARYAAALQKTEADFCYAPIRRVDVNDKFTGVSRPKVQKVYAGVPFCHQALATRRTQFHALGGFDTRLKIMADYDFALRHFLSDGTNIELEAPLATFRAGGASDDGAALLSEKERIWRKNFSRFDLKGTVDWARAARVSRAPITVFWNMMRSKDLGPAAKRLALHELIRSTRKSLQYIGRDK